MAEKRPINLDLWTLRFPSMAIASILHRISGVVIFLFLPLVTYILGMSLASESSFMRVHEWLSMPCGAFLLWSFLTALTFHLLAGIRHMIMDLGFGESVSTGRWTAFFVMGLSVLISLMTGIWLW